MHAESASYGRSHSGEPVLTASSLDVLIRRLLEGDARALARAISLVEDDAPEAPRLLSACFPQTGRALRIGITGAPGAGKSTLVDRLGENLREAGKTVGVLAVDPSSPFTGGAILGDRIRVRNRHDDAGFYFRSMATRGALGGLALNAADVALLIEASGKDVVLIETVGVGQDEVEIARLADITLVVLVPGMGDDVQSLKAGVMEIADLYVINKADREGAERVEQEIRSLQSLAPAKSGWVPPVVRTVATSGEGVDTLFSAVASLHSWLAEGDRLAERRARNWQRRLDQMLRAELIRRARRSGVSEEQLRAHAGRVAARKEDPWRLVARLASNVMSTESQADLL